MVQMNIYSIKLENDWFSGGKMSHWLACKSTWVVGSLSQTHKTGTGAIQSLRYVKGNLLFSSINQKQINFLVKK